MSPLEQDLSNLARTHPEVREALGAGATLEDFMTGFRHRLRDLEIIIQDEFSRDVLLPLSNEECLVLSAG